MKKTLLYTLVIVLCISFIFSLSACDNKESARVHDELAEVFNTVNIAEYKVLEVDSNCVKIECSEYGTKSPEGQLAVAKAIFYRMRLIETNGNKPYENLDWVKIYPDSGSESYYFFITESIYFKRKQASSNPNLPAVNVLKPGLYYGKDSIGLSDLIILDDD